MAAQPGKTPKTMRHINPQIKNAAVKLDEK